MKLITNGLYIELLPRRAVDDEDWVRIQAIIKANGFTGDIEAWLQLDDLKRFESQINLMYQSPGVVAKATLECFEPGIRIDLEMKVLGGITGNYQFQSEDIVPRYTTLSGPFELDQSYLPSMAQEIRELVSELQNES